ncbi:MAG: T9SS type A sorting domain-containing protein [Phaeodactylibacter sp.]|nr:T9SS type A sorting domain-containing protein [Phaeodactylibacter sp.]
MSINNAKIGLLTLCWTGFFGTGLFAQTWSAVWTFGGAGNESLRDLALTSADGYLISANYAESFVLGDQDLPDPTGTDVLLFQLDADGQLAWTVQGGSADDDQAGPVCVAADQSIYWSGAFWETAQIGGQSFSGSLPGKSLFLLKLDANGQPQWQHSFSGTGDKEWVALHTDAAGNLYSLGNFSATLDLAGTPLTSPDGQGLFAVKWDPAGNLIWARAFPGSNQVKATALVVHQEQLFVCGYQNGELTLSNGVLWAETSDQDGFLLALDTAGGFQWARSIGAQYNDFAQAVVVNEQQEVIVAGHYMGVLRISESLEVQTPGFNHNLFEARFSREGEPLSLHQWGGLGEEFAQSLWSSGNSLLLAGSHEDALAIGNFNLPPPIGLRSGFVANFGPDQAVYWNLDVPGQGLILPRVVRRKASGQVLLAGSFNESLDLNGGTFPAAGAYDLFLLLANSSVVAPKAIPVAESYTCFPNPSDGRLQLKGPLPVLIEVVNAAGQVVLQQVQRQPELNLTHLPDGQYYLQFLTEGFQVQRTCPLTIQR